jgi:hypothetical protein
MHRLVLMLLLLMLLLLVQKGNTCNRVRGHNGRSWTNPGWWGEVEGLLLQGVPSNPVLS